MDFNISFFDNNNNSDNKSTKNSLDDLKGGNEIKEDKEKSNENKKTKKNENNSREDSSDLFDDDEDDESKNNMASNSVSFDDEEEEKENESPTKNKIDDPINEINKTIGMQIINANEKDDIIGGDGDITNIKDGYLFKLFDFYLKNKNWYIKGTNEYLAQNLTTYELFENLNNILGSNSKLNDFIVNISSYSKEISKYSTFKLFMKLCDFFKYYSNVLVERNLQRNIQPSNIIYNQAISSLMGDAAKLSV